MMELLPYIDMIAVVIAMVGAYWKINTKLDAIKRETEENRDRSLAAQDVVAKNTEAINQLMIVMVRIEERLK